MTSTSESRAAVGPGFFRAAWTVADKDLRIELRTREGLSSMVLFSLIVLLVFSFSFDLAAIREIGVARLVPGVIWITLAFSGIVGFSRSFQIEARNDSMTALLLSPTDRSAVFGGKAFANLVTLAVLEIVVLPLSAVFFDFDLLAVLGPILLVVALHTVGLALLGTLLGAVANRVGRGEALVAILLFPAATPLFISAVKCTSAVLAADPLSSVRSWLLLSAAFDLLYLFGGLWLFEFVVEE